MVYQGDFQEARSEVIEMAQSIRLSLSQIIQEADWLDSETRQAALVKLKETIAKIGFEGNPFDDIALDAKYKD